MRDTTKYNLVWTRVGFSSRQAWKHTCRHTWRLLDFSDSRLRSWTSELWKPFSDGLDYGRRSEAAAGYQWKTKEIWKRLKLSWRCNFCARSILLDPNRKPSAELTILALDARAVHLYRPQDSQDSVLAVDGSSFVGSVSWFILIFSLHVSF